MTFNLVFWCSSGVPSIFKRVRLNLSTIPFPTGLCGVVLDIYTPTDCTLTFLMELSKFLPCSLWVLAGKPW